MDKSQIITRTNDLQTFWQPRNQKMKDWYRLIEMVDELKTANMESFVGNDPRNLYNLMLHLLDAPLPHMMPVDFTEDYKLAEDANTANEMLTTAWDDNETRFRLSNPRTGLKRTAIQFLLATGWYSIFNIISDFGDKAFIDVFNPAECYPMWSGGRLSELAHIYSISKEEYQSLAFRNNWRRDLILPNNMDIRDYWFVEFNSTGTPIVWNSIVVNNELVKNETTRFKTIPITIGPVGGLPDMGAITESYSTSGCIQVNSNRWKAELGQAVVATNENVYRTWNKWWSYSLQLLRDTAQARIKEKSTGGKVIVKPEDVFKRGAIWRMGPNDDVDFVQPPVIPIEIRSAQLDLEAMAQRGGASWAMFGAVSGQISSYVMSQISASANQVARPFHEGIQNFAKDIDTNLIEETLSRGVSPYGYHLSQSIKKLKVSNDYEIEIPGDMLQKLTVARMANPEFRLSYTYVMNKLFKDVKNPARERARIRADQAELHPANGIIALIQYYKAQAAFLHSKGQDEVASLYDQLAEATKAQLIPQQQQLQSGATPTQYDIEQGQLPTEINQPSMMPPNPNVAGQQTPI